ncbi:MAG: SGNH/GDSL hydrolase family protein [Myxococcota bacterium]|nr:SGNH/GDSL hydrolase family protein [Myxococcota bacterium]
MLNLGIGEATRWAGATLGLASVLTVAACGASGSSNQATPDQPGQTHADGGADTSARSGGNGDARSGPSGKYVAMGSSAASGPGIPDPVPGQSCGRSTNNYAHLIAADLGLDLTEVSCNGAIIDNITAVPQGDNPLQIRAITADTQIVTVSIGGNDVRYWASLVTCGQDGANGTSCLGDDAGSAADAGAVDTAAIDQLIGAEQQKLVDMLTSVKQAAPSARIFLVAYLRVLPEPPIPCPPRAPFASADATFLGALGNKLQDALVRAAQEAGVHFVDIYSASQGHDVCASEGQRWLEGQTPPAVVPYHANATGMRAEADLIEVEIRRTF